MKKKVGLLVCLLISAGWGGGFCEVSIATKAIDRTNILSNDDEQFQVVTGFTAQLPNRIDRAKFDAEIREGSFAQQFSQGLNSRNKEFQFANLTALTLEDKIGEVSAGWTTRGKIQGVTMNVELALFRRGKIGSFMAIMYLDGTQPTITISEAARKLDSRRMELKPDLTQPQ